MKWFTCPVVTCRAENDVSAEVCVKCDTPLGAYKSLSMFPEQLFNNGLAAARNGQIRRAHDLFAAVVYWCPNDREAHNAFAMACFALEDYEEARSHWEKVLEQFSQDSVALDGIEALENFKSDKTKGRTGAHVKRSKREKKRLKGIKFKY